jgi:hypothetical protein
MSVSGLHVTTPVRDVWELLLKRDPDALVTQTPAWMRCMRQFGYEDVSRKYEFPSGAQFVLPMVSRALPRVTSLDLRASMPPAWGMGGLIGDPAPTATEMTAIVGDLRSLGALRVSVRPNPLHAERWAAAMDGQATAIPRLAHVLELEGGPARLWSGLTKSARQGVRKAERQGVEIECDTTGRLVPAFFELYSLSVERWARTQHEPLWLARWRAHHRDTQAKFDRLAAELGEVMRVWVARKDGVPVAAAIVLVGTNASYTRAAMDKSLASPVCANDLLQWHAIEDACRAGCRRYHMGESGSSSSLAFYKEKFGARPFLYAEYRIERLPLSAADAALRDLVKHAIGFRDVGDVAPEHRR